MVGVNKYFYRHSYIVLKYVDFSYLKKYIFSEVLLNKNNPC